MPPSGRKFGFAGGQSQYIREDDSIASTTIAHIVDVLAEGEIRGLVDGRSSIYADEIPLEDSEGNSNFPDGDGIQVEVLPGTPDQPVSTLVDEPAGETNYALPVTAAAPLTVDDAITDADVDSAIVTIRFPRGLVRVTDEGQFRTLVELTIESRASGGPWITHTAGLDRSQRDTGSRDTSVTTADGVNSFKVFQGAQANTGGRYRDFELTYQWEYRLIGAPTWTPGPIQFAVNESRAPRNVSFTFNSPLFEGLVTGQYEARLASALPEWLVTGTLKINEYFPNDRADVYGKSSVGFEKAWRFPLPTGSPPYDIRLTRHTPDHAADSEFRDDFELARIAEIKDVRINYQRTAYAAVSATARQFSGRIPRRAYEIEGRIIRIPSNYDPVTRIYSGAWDGIYQWGYSNNPAWVLLDVLCSERVGLGLDPDTGVDKWGLYTIAQYSDEMVEDGPRFTFNGELRKPDEAYKVVTAIAGAMRVLVYVGNDSRVHFSQDSPQAASRLFTPANVLEGSFEYASTPLKERVTACNVTYYDPADFYRPAVAVVEDRELIGRLGFRPRDIVAYGCTVEAQAVRRGKYEIETSRIETETVAFSIAANDAALRPGEVILIADPTIAGIRAGGRTAAGTTRSAIVLDAPFTVLGGQTYSVLLQMPDDSVEEQTVSNTPGETSTLSLVSDFSTDPVVQSPYIIRATSVEPKPWRVLSVEESEDYTYRVRGVAYDAQKFDIVDGFTQLRDLPDYTFVDDSPLPAPQGLTMDPYIYQAPSLDGTEQLVGVFASWEQVADPRVAFYEIEARDTEIDEIDTRIVSGTSYDYKPLPAGIDVTMRVRAVDATLQRRSGWSELAKTVNVGGEPPSDITGLVGTSGGETILLAWDRPPEIDVSGYIIRFTDDTSSPEWRGAGTIEILDNPATTRHRFPIAIPGAFLIKARNRTGQESVNAAIHVNTVDGTQSFYGVDVFQAEPAWNGTLNNVVRVGNEIRLSGSSGSYPLVGWIDLADEVSHPDIVTGLVAGVANAYGLATAQPIAAWDPIASAQPLAQTVSDNWEIVEYFRTSNDGGANWTNWRRAEWELVTANRIQFRLELYSFDGFTTPSVTSYGSGLFLSKRTESGNGTSDAGGNATVTYRVPFAQDPNNPGWFNPEITLTADASDYRDAAIIISSNRFGFTLQTRRSNSTAGNINFSWIAVGFGGQ